MKRKAEPYTDLDLMMLRGGWRTLPRELENAAESTRTAGLRLKVRERIANALHRAGAWLEMHAQRNVPGA